MNSKSKLILSLQFLLLLVYIILLCATELRPLFRGDRVVGIALFATGAITLVMAVVAYRRAVGTIKVKPSPEPAEQGGLITQGVYSFIRHPFYTATPIILAGTALAVRKPWGLAMIPVVIGLLYWKSSYEETLLALRFPEYLEYKKKTGRFLPRLRKK